MIGQSLTGVKSSILAFRIFVDLTSSKIASKSCGVEFQGAVRDEPNKKQKG
jgi:hypothetical protein